jgi:signal transduction histidine kinase/FixJ family two-component response regulator
MKTAVQQVKPSILLVDNSPWVLDMLEEILGGLDYPILRLEAGRKVSALLERERVALVFCNVFLPDIDGIDVLRTIKQYDSAIQVVMLSGHQDFGVVRDVLREKAFDYLLLPFPRKEVLKTAEEGLGAYYHLLKQNRSRLEARRRMADLVLLRKVGEHARSGNDLKELFDEIVDSIVLSAGVEAASLMLLESDGMLHIKAANGLPSEIVDHVCVGSGEGVSGHVLATGEPILVVDIELDGRFKSINCGQRYKNQSLLSVPIYVREELVGVINVNNKKSGESFDLEDQHLLEAIANWVALAMENFKLINSLRQQALVLEKNNEDLVRMHRARTRLVCNLSHELKTPLTSIMGYLDLSLSFYEKMTDVELKGNLEEVRGEGVRLERLISGMLRLFSIESEREVWRWKSFAVAWPIADALQQHNKQLIEQGLSTELDIVDDLPDVYGDQEKFSIAFSGLVDNAIKFNREGGCIRVLARPQIDEGLEYVYLQIYNDGQSVPIDGRETIFNSYTQLGDIDTEKPHGVGIGLSLVKVVVDRMLGDVFLEEVDGEGTCFAMMLPTETTFNILKG